jgi:excisionase family DNA binding protein
MPYEVAEAAALLGVHRNTVRHWIKQGLRPLDDKRPMLIHGSELRRFLVDRKQRHQVKCAPDELYCFGCRKPRTPGGGATEITPITTKTAMVTAICGVCGALMHRMIRCEAIPLFAEPAPPDAGPGQTNRALQPQSELSLSPGMPS